MRPRSMVSYFFSSAQKPCESPPNQAPESEVDKAIQLTRVQTIFMDVMSNPRHESSKVIDLKHLLYLKNDVGPIVRACRDNRYKSGDLLQIAQVALDTVPQTPRRRALNEYFSSFQGRAEKNFLKPPPGLCILNTDDQKVLQEEVNHKLRADEDTLREMSDAHERYFLLEKMRRTALSTLCGQDFVLQDLQIRTVAAAILAKQWPEVVHQWLCNLHLMGPPVNSQDYRFTSLEAINAIVSAKSTLLKLFEECRLEQGSAAVFALSKSLESLERGSTLAPVTHIEAPRNKINEFLKDLRVRIENLPETSSLRQAVDASLDEYQEATKDEQASISKRLYSLSLLPPLRPLEAVKLPQLSTPNDTNEFRELLQQIFDEEVVGHTSTKRRLIQEVVAMRQCSDKKGFAVLLKGPSGVGKNTIAAALAKSFGRELHIVSGSSQKDANSVTGDRRVFIGSSPGVAASILLKMKKPSVIMWDEIGKAGSEFQKAVHQIADFDANDKVRDNYLGDVDLDFSSCIHVFALNDGESILDSLEQRACTFHLKGLSREEKTKILSKEGKKIGPTYFRIHKEHPSLETIFDTLINRRISEPGVRNLVDDIKNIYGALSKFKDAGAMPEVSDSFVLQCLAEAEVKRIPFQPQKNTDEVALFDLTQGIVEEGTEALEAPRRLWRVAAYGSDFQISIDQESCSFEVLSAKAFCGFMGLALIAPDGQADGIFIEKSKFMWRKDEKNLMIYPSAIQNPSDGTESSALTMMMKSGKNGVIRLALSPISKHLSHVESRKVVQDALYKKGEQ